jgi:hypothetical protein
MQKVKRAPNGSRLQSVALEREEERTRPIQQWQIRYERLPGYFLPDALKTRVLRHYLRCDVDELDEEVRAGPVDYSEESEAYDHIVTELGIDPQSLDPLHKRDVERIISAFSLWLQKSPGKLKRGRYGPTLDEAAADLGELLKKRWEQRANDANGEPVDSYEEALKAWHEDGAGQALHRWPRNGPRKYDGSW